MSVTALALNALLAVLLIVALGFGWRLERRLKALRDSHAGFAKAVAELDQAAARAEQGLADLRAATDEASEALADRIQRATALASQLDERLNRPIVTPPPVERAPSPSREPAAPSAAERRLKAEDFERLLEREAKASRPGEPAPRLAAAKETPRSRARVDDDLFEGPDEPPGPGSNFRARR